MINAIIVDDEMHCLETLGIMLADYCPEIRLMEKCRSATQALAAIDKLQPELVFLDIEMPLMNGFELLEKFSSIPFAVIFTTSYDQYAIKAIRFSALDYLLKPIDIKELINAVHKVTAQKTRPGADQFQMLLDRVKQREKCFNRIAIPTLEGFELIAAANLIRCEADDNYTHLFLKDKSRLTACRTLKEIEEQLNDFSFFLRVHHSYLVNLNEVQKYVKGEGGYLMMSDGSVVNVSRSRKEALMKYF